MVHDSPVACRNVPTELAGIGDHAAEQRTLLLGIHEISYPGRPQPEAAPRLRNGRAGEVRAPMTKTLVAWFQFFYSYE